ncbi:glutathione S-transferase family protein [Novosphingobium album (ex Hu et al. 2023)]|uniref:Glutathione S-transferase family protein n=1 Tax=Novosphingobium album (ex Hu et al. 2023) TaxID=2930093 RepID=A0ABT0B3I1_9SPHN|nr:glutathione S-transferase family protein [Novosphingobium album (ex Hu et al. 2023)]MCJ2179600.1 glutathione S-transferase family protein [Novosphingobium album (ex Hu et al. 2023)]
MPVTITAFAASPDRGRGMARDMPVRWALEEVGRPYEVRLVSFAEMKEPAHLGLQPFGQIPTYEDGTVALFESGAIVLHIAQSHAGLLPEEPGARGRAIAWLFAALSTMEPPVLDRETAGFLEASEPWHAARQPLLESRICARLDALAASLGEAEWLVDGAFSAGDLQMVTVLRRLGSSGLLDGYPTLAAYVARAEARPAFQRAFAAQRAVFEASGGG